MKWYKTKLGRIFVGDAVALDELGNAFVLEGNPHETISAHCGAQLAAKQACLFCRIVCKILGHFFTGHCQRAWRDEKALVNDSKNLNGVNSSNPSGK